MTAVEARLARIVARLEAALPAGLTAQDLEGFVDRHRATLLEIVATTMPEASEGSTTDPRRSSEPSPTPEGPGARSEGPDGTATSDRPVGDASPPTTVARRTEANLTAMALLAEHGDRPWTDAERDVLARYTGWGGLSLDRVRTRIPDGVPVPDASALLHEYYTPVAVTDEVARLVRPLLPELADDDGVISALEPSAGVGRFVQSMTGPGFEALRWSLVEAAPVAARILEARFSDRPDVREVWAGTFESWVKAQGPQHVGKLRLVVANPPYGPRGAALTVDPDRSYRDKQASAYFLRRGLDLLGPGGLGVFLIPAGFLTGSSAAAKALRRKVLLRHHLSTAYRLPSALFPGAHLVTDLLLFRTRAQPLDDVPPSDQFVLDGAYYTTFPAHILGTEVKAEDGSGRRARFGYQVLGDFTGLPDPVERVHQGEPPTVPSTPVEPAPSADRTLSSGTRPGSSSEAVSLAVAEATALGHRVDRYLAAMARTDSDEPSQLWPELRDALTAWVVAHGAPARHRGLRSTRKSGPDEAKAALTRFVAAFEPSGELVAALRTAPDAASRYPGTATDVVAQAEWLYRSQRRLTDAELLRFHRAQGGPLRRRAAVVDAAIAAGWARNGESGDELVPPEDYVTGDLWPKVDRARRLARTGDAAAQAQLDRLMDAIEPVVFEDIDDVSPRQGWVPMSLVAGWMSETLNARYGAITLNCTDGLVAIEGLDYDDVERTRDLSPEARWCLGWINHDRTVFRPRKRRGESLDEVRLALGAAWDASFRQWVGAEAGRREQLTEAYNRRFRGYVAPSYGTEPLAIARWDPSAVRLHPHQVAGARRLLANRGGLLAFDVGVGKTYTALATLARARQEGWCRRPVIVVPNSIVWKWHADIARVLPDYRVAVIGSKQTVVRRGAAKGRVTSASDTPDERARKWTAFQAGRVDVVLLTYTALARTALDPVRAEAHAERTAAIRRSIRLSQRTARAQTKALTERQEALLAEGTAAWVAERLELPVGWSADPGIVWDDLGIDLLICDEAQNFKNLHMPEPREGGVPRFMGNAGPGSQRAWQLDFRAAAVRRHTGGSGVVLLSATPAKNSPLEFYNLIQYVDPEAWTSRGIRDPEQFIDRYLRIELQPVVDSKLQVVERGSVTGFRNLHELRDVLFRYGEFKTADDVGLTLPTPTVEVVEVGLDPMQEDKSARYVAQIEQALEDRRTDTPVLGLLARLALVAIHPRLDEGLSWKSAERVDPHSPKLHAMMARVLKTPTCGHIVFVDNTAVHRWAKQVLVEAGIPADRIAVLNAHTAKAAADRQRIARAFNGDPDEGRAPEYDVVIANAIAYEGIDLQTRTCAIHHLDLPWEPATLQQRNGRGVRQGNTLGAIEILYYFARRSQDGLRFSLIQGKLGWMQELLQSQRRDTNNPGAQLALGPEEILLLISRDPEQTKERLAKVKERRAMEARKKVAADATRLLRSANARFREAERAVDPTKAVRLREDAEERLADLTKVDPDAWPWAPWAVAARERPIWVPADGWPPLHEGLRLRLRDPRDETRERFVEFGRVREDAIAAREARTARWVSVTAAQLAAWPIAVEDLTATWPEDDAVASMKAAGEHLDRHLAAGFGDWPALGWRDAAEGWLEAVWEVHGGLVVERLAEARLWSAQSQRVPVEVDGRLAIGRGAELRKAALLPPTEAGWRRFLGLAADSDLAFAEIAATGSYWWDRRVPRTVRSNANAEAA